MAIAAVLSAGWLGGGAIVELAAQAATPAKAPAPVTRARTAAEGGSCAIDGALLALGTTLA